MKKLLALIISLLIIVPAYAEMTGGGYTINIPTISGGGEEEMTGGDYEMQDIKGQGVVGEMSGGGYEIGLGGVYGTVVAAEAPPGWSEDPHVRNLRISRSGSDILVEWDPEPGTFTGPFYVFRLTREFENASANWSSGINVGSDTSYTDSGQNRGGDAQVYYRVLSTSSKTSLVDRVAVGKINYAFSAGNTYFNYPFANTADVNTVFGTSGFNNISKILDYVKVSDNFEPTTFGTGGWSGAFPLVLGRGYVFFNNGDSATNVTLVGPIADPASFSRNINAGNNYIGTPFPVSMTLSESFATAPQRLDGLLIYDRTSDAFEKESCSTDGAFDHPSFTLSPTIGYVYFRNSGDFNWQPRL